MGCGDTRTSTELSPSQYDVLATVSFRERVRLSDLAAIEGINPTLLSRIVGKLEEPGSSSREQDADDRRVAHVARHRRRVASCTHRIRDERTDVLSLALDSLERRTSCDAADSRPCRCSSRSPSTVRERSL